MVREPLELGQDWAMTLRVKFRGFYLVSKIPFTIAHYFHRSEIQAKNEITLVIVYLYE